MCTYVSPSESVLEFSLAALSLSFSLFSLLSVSSGVSQSGALSAQRGVSLSPSPREQARQEELVSSPPPSAMRWRLPFKVGRGMEEEEEEEVTPAAVRRGGRKGGGES